MSWTNDEITYLVSSLDLLSDHEFELVRVKLQQLRPFSDRGELADALWVLEQAWGTDNDRRERNRHHSRDPVKRHPMTAIVPGSALDKLAEANKAWEPVDGYRVVTIHEKTKLERTTPWWQFWDRQFRVVLLNPNWHHYNKFGMVTAGVLTPKSPWWQFWKRDFRLTQGKVDK